MPLPEINITWLYRVNRSMAQDTAYEHRQYMLLEIVRSILGVGTGWTDAAGVSVTPASPWQVYSSSDSVTADATNRWLDVDDVQWAAEGIAHSWIVLEHPSFFDEARTLYLCINCSQGGETLGATIGVFLSSNAFAGGTTTNRPTAVDEIEVLPDDGSMATAPWQGADTDDEDHRVGRLHCMLSDDGLNFRVVICRDGVDVAWWDLFRAPDYDELQWEVPVVMAVTSHDADTALLTWTNIGDTAMYHARDNVSIAAEFALEPSMTYLNTTPVTALPANPLTGDSDWAQILLGGRTPGAGVWTAIPDARWGRAAEPDAAFGDDRTFQQFSEVVIPWNTSVCVKS